tara:strand:+ start:720 stop:1601 length:882 start_codon:yes stop_codon:yes gene_type:complete
VIELRSPKECRHAYRELLQGYTHVEKEDFYIKHFKESDLGFIDGVYQKCFEQCKKQGLFSREEKIELLKKEDFWDQHDDEQRVFLQQTVRDGYEYARGLGKKESLEFLEEHVIPKEKELKKLEKDIIEIVEPVAETHCEKVLNEQYVYHALFKSKDCKTPLFTKEQFEDLSFLEMGDLIKLYNYHSSRFTETNINKIAVNSFFLNPFFMSEDDPVKFYGKNVVDLTMYQLNIYSRGKFCKAVLVEGKEPPEQYFSENEIDGLLKLVQWYDSGYSQIKQKKMATQKQGRTLPSL